MTKEELKEKCGIIAQPISKRLDDAIDKILSRNCINLDKADERVVPSALMAAIFEDMGNCCLNGLFNEEVKKQIKKEYKNIKNFVPASW